MRIFLKILFFSALISSQAVALDTNSGAKNLRTDSKPKTTTSTKKESPKKEVKAEKKLEKEIVAETKKDEQKQILTKSSERAKKMISQKLWHGITASDLEILKKTAVALEKKDYNEAMKFARGMKNSHSSDKNSFSDALIDIVLWNKFSDKIDPKKVSFSDISRFATDNSFYPNINEIRRNVERVAIANNIPYQASAQYFNSNPSETKESKIFFLNSKVESLSQNKISEENKEKERKIIRDLIINIWIKENLSADEEKNFLEKYGNQLSEAEHIKRIKRLIWENKYEDAERIMFLVNEDYQKLFLAVNEFEKNPPKHIDKLYHSVPWSLRLDELLTYRRVLWYRSKDKMDDVMDLMLSLSNKSEFPEKWWNLRRLFGREMIKKKKYKQALKLFAEHNLPKNHSDFWEAEWTAGWIALRFLDEPRKAYAHFGNMYRNVVQPVTLSRASYWLGMAAEAAGDKNQANKWYKNGAKYPVFFYGQLSIHKHRITDPLGSQNDIILPKDPEVTGEDIRTISESRAAQVAFLLSIIGDKTNATKIFDWIVNNAKTDGEIGVVMYLVNEIGDRQLDARISRTASKRNVFFIKDKFQIVKEVSGDEYAPLIHAIIKQESGFAPSAMSHVGAMGYMQLMPATAQLVARELGISYSKKKLATDIHYNIHLGSFYIKKLINHFEGSEMMAIAAYNAGPNAVQRWVNEFYDPRKEKDIDKVIDWIELITYSETRNYVQRIMENLIVYKYMMSRTNYDSVQ